MADTVICMEAFRARDVTAEALAIDARFGASPALGEGGGLPYPPVRARVPVSILPGSPSGAPPHRASDSYRSAIALLSQAATESEVRTSSTQVNRVTAACQHLLTAPSSAVI